MASLATSIAGTGTSKILAVSSSSSKRIGFPVISHPNSRVFFLFSKAGIFSRSAVRASNQEEATVSPFESVASSPGLYSAQTFDLTPQNVDLVLEDVRPFLISDGGNVDVVSVEDGVVSLKLQGWFFFYEFRFDKTATFFV